MTPSMRVFISLFFLLIFFVCIFYVSLHAYYHAKDQLLARLLLLFMHLQRIQVNQAEGVQVAVDLKD